MPFLDRDCLFDLEGLPIATRDFQDTKELTLFASGDKGMHILLDERGKLFIRQNEVDKGFPQDVYYPYISKGYGGNSINFSATYSDPWGYFPDLPIRVHKGNHLLSIDMGSRVTFLDMVVEPGAVDREKLKGHLELPTEIKRVSRIFQFRDEDNYLMIVSEAFPLEYKNPSVLMVSPKYGVVEDYKVKEYNVARDGGTTHAHLEDSQGRKVLLYIPTSFQKEKVATLAGYRLTSLEKDDPLRLTLIQKSGVLIEPHELSELKKKCKRT